MSAERCPVCDREACRRWTWATSLPVISDLFEFWARDDNHGERSERDDCARHRHDWRAEALALRAEKARPLTVGAALAMPEVQDGSHVVEWPSVVEGAWWQIRPKDPCGRVAARGHSWGLWAPIDLGVWIMAIPWAIPCRLVPLSLADLDPATRGPLP